MYFASDLFFLVLDDLFSEFFYLFFFLKRSPFSPINKREIQEKLPSSCVRVTVDLNLLLHDEPVLPIGLRFRRLFRLAPGVSFKNIL